jgi:hypothetical protein
LSVSALAPDPKRARSLVSLISRKISLIDRFNSLQWGKNSLFSVRTEFARNNLLLQEFCAVVHAIWAPWAQNSLLIAC